LTTTIAAGNGDDHATRDAMNKLQDKLALNKDADSAPATRLKELEDADAEMQSEITHIVTQLQAGDAAGTLAAPRKIRTDVLIYSREYPKAGAPHRPS
jgi:hypothetical protein